MDADGSSTGLRQLLANENLTAAAAEGVSSIGNIICIVLFVLFVVLGGYFAGSESCFSAVNKIRIKSLAENEGNRRARIVMYITNGFDRALTTLLIGNNITHIAAASVATLFVTNVFGSSDTVTLVSTFVTTGIVFLFSEMIPKSFANDRSETMSLACAPSLRFLMKVFSPLVAFFTAISDFVSRLFKSEEKPTITEDEFIDIIDNAEEQKVINDEESDLMKSVLDMAETTASDVMTMREDIVSLDIHLSNRQIVDALKNIRHSRVLITDGSPDRVVGVLPVRKFIRAYMNNRKFDKRSVLLKPHFVNPHDTIDELLDSMRQNKIYLGIVRDEQKKVCGIVTIEDFLEELVGEIWDEEDVVDYDFYKLGGNRFSVSASLKVADVFARIGVPLPERGTEGKSIGVWATQKFGRIPEEDESFVLGNLEIIVEKINATRILKLIVHVMDEEDLAELAKEAAENAEAEK